MDVPASWEGAAEEIARRIRTERALRSDLYVTPDGRELPGRSRARV